MKYILIGIIATLCFLPKAYSAEWEHTETGPGFEVYLDKNVNFIGDTDTLKVLVKLVYDPAPKSPASFAEPIPSEMRLMLGKMNAFMGKSGILPIQTSVAKYSINCSDASFILHQITYYDAKGNQRMRPHLDGNEVVNSGRAPDWIYLNTIAASLCPMSREEYQKAKLLNR